MLSPIKVFSAFYFSMFPGLFYVFFFFWLTQQRSCILYDIGMILSTSTERNEVKRLKLMNRSLAGVWEIEEEVRKDEKK